MQKARLAIFEIFGVSNKELADWIHYNTNYDQLILEYWKESDPKLRLGALLIFRRQ